MSHLPGFTSFEEDPFFEGHKQRMSDFARFSPYSWWGGRDAQHGAGAGAGAGAGSPALQIQPAPETNAAVERRHQHDLFSPFRCQDLFRDLSGQVNSLMRRMDSMSERMMNMPMEVDNNDSHSYTQSSVYTYKNNGERDPHVYEAHHSRRTAPGGVREETKALRDTEKNLEKMSVGRHLGNRGHVMEKTTRTDTNETHHKQNLIGLHDSEVEQFKSDWKTATAGFGTWGAVGDAPQQPAALEGVKGKKTKSKM